MADASAAGVKGPVVDTNSVFDSAFTLAAPPSTMALDVFTDATVGTVKAVPGGTYTVSWTFTFKTFAEGEIVEAPYRISLALGAGKASRAANSAWASGANTWERYDVSYEGWTFGTTCTNTQFGATPVDAEADLPTMTNLTPACAVNSAGALIITIDEDLTSAAWDSFLMKFDIAVTNPSN